MRQESNHRMSNGERDSVKISNSRAMGVIVLIALLFLFQVVTFVVQKVRMRQVEAVTDAGAGGGAGISGAGPSVAVGSKTFPFNPNTITEDSLQMLGFSQQQAASIIKYRTKGGKFRVKRDFSSSGQCEVCCSGAIHSSSRQVAGEKGSAQKGPSEHKLGRKKEKCHK